MVGGTAAVVWGVDDTVDALAGEFDLPMITYTPYAIFSNSIPVFDINFFEPMDNITQETDVINIGSIESANATVDNFKTLC